MTALLFAQRVPADAEDALRFKTEYEALNGSVTQAGEQYLSVEIPAENQVIYLTAEEAASLLETGTGVVLMGHRGAHGAAMRLLHGWMQHGRRGLSGCTVWI